MMAAPEAVKSFFEDSQISVVLPTEEKYRSLSEFYSLSDPKVPLALVRPRNASEITIAVRYAVKNGIKIIVRSGGGDLFGRSQAAGTLVIDMRQMYQVEINSDQQTARVGGGCNVGQVAASLAEHGFATSCPPIPKVGYIGWATLGGYGPFAPHFGLGVDQIVAAKLINCDGDLVCADQELLKGLRGAGGNFGIIAELTVKVYPLQKILGGMILFESSNLDAAFQDYAQAYNALLQAGLPPALGLQIAVVNSEHGRMFGTLFVWSSDDHATGYEWLEKVAALGKEQMRMVSPMTVREWQEEMNKLVPYGIYGDATAVSVKSITKQIAQVIARNVARLPSDKATAFSWHELRGNSTNANADSVFLAREPHYILEILAGVEDRNNLDESEAWANEFRSELLQCNGVLPSNYISLTRPAHTTLQRLYGSNLEEVQRLKKKFDPNGTFSLAVPRLT